MDQAHALKNLIENGTQIEYFDNGYIMQVKELQDQDKIKLQIFDEAISRIKSIPTDESTTERSFMQPTDEQQSARNHKKYNINKYKEVERTTAQVEPEEAIQKLAEEQPRNIYLSHPNLEVQKFVIDTIWRTITKRQRGDDFVFSSDNFIKFWAQITQNDEDDVEIILVEAIIQPHTCIPKKLKKKDLKRVMDMSIKNVSVSVIDNVLWNSIEQLYRINKDFARLSDAPTSEITKDDF
ncbi:MAG: hypothetical protein EZS28_030748 [Streblomastix strix]|uniref:Uncharacterized protein n=1 Tax=Streblomastix strix TaxID=222440 RepID=A0A5J4USV3_9EUKA|nr:MAG: hypothetical protein EZS28_030748 [Streblomastix strix]